jgi:RHS repeat-associated protein
LMTHSTEPARIRPGFDVTLLPQRNYDTTLGRFTSFDTFEGQIADPITLNHYIYAGADPVDNIDPSGHDFSLGEIGVTISIGVGVPIGLGAASSAVYAKVLGGNAGKGFVAGLQLGVAFDIAYFSTIRNRARMTAIPDSAALGRQAVPAVASSSAPSS